MKIKDLPSVEIQTIFERISKISLEIFVKNPLLPELFVTTLTAQHHPACYPTDPIKTLAFFRNAFASCPAKELPPAPKNSTLLGVVTPHIDFRVSLPAYAAAFRPLLDEPLAETYLILGVGHRSRLDWNFDRRDYATPPGTRDLRYRPGRRACGRGRSHASFFPGCP